MAFPAPVHCAFFDVDETLIRRKSMAGFLQHYLDTAVDLPDRDADELRRGAARLTRRTAGSGWRGRAALNREYYRLFRGHRYDRLRAAGRDWFAAQSRRGDLYHPGVRAALADHRARGFRIVLVSGSFAPCLEPIAEDVGADLAVGARLLEYEGVLTGEIRQPVIGRGKAAAARRALESFGASPGGSYAYGDHISDLPLLRSIWHPVVVGGHGLLGRCAGVAGWPVIATRPSDRPVDHDPPLLAAADPTGQQGVA